MTSKNSFCRPRLDASTASTTPPTFTVVSRCSPPRVKATYPLALRWTLALTGTLPRADVRNPSECEGGVQIATLLGGLLLDGSDLLGPTIHGISRPHQR